MNKGTRIVAVVIVCLLVFSLLASLVVPFWHKHRKCCCANHWGASAQPVVDKVPTAAFLQDGVVKNGYADGNHPQGQMESRVMFSRNC